MKKKGFTLIELLAVIVILAIIAIIAVPQILNVVDKAKKGAAESSAYGYIDAVEKYIALQEVNGISFSDGTYQISRDEVEVSFLGIIEKVYADDTLYLNDVINVKGKKPSKGYVKIANSKVEKSAMVIDGYNVSYDINRNPVLNVDGKTNSSESQDVSQISAENVEYINTNMNCTNVKCALDYLHNNIG